MPSNLPLLPGTLASDCYPASAQAFYTQMFALGSAQLGDLTGIIISEAQPGPDDRDKAWIKVVAGKPIWGYAPAIWFSTAWVIPHPEPANSPARKLWAGSEALLATYDGGDGGVPGDASGPMWLVDHAMDGRSPMGPGTLPSGATLAFNGTMGEEKHVLTGAEGAIGSHTHAYGLYVPGTGGGFAGQTTPSATSAYQSLFIGESTPSGANPVTANMFTLPPNLGAGATSDAHNTVHPVLGLFLIKRSGRIFIKVA